MVANNKLELIIVGISHRFTQLEQRACYQWTQDKQIEWLNQLREYAWCQEGMWVITCYRSECVLLTSHPKAVLTWWHSVFEDFKGQGGYVKSGQHAYKHMLNTCIGLDSKVLGEAQILGQYKQASVFFEQQGFVKSRLKRLCALLWRDAKKVRNISRLGYYSDSLAKIVVQRIRCSRFSLKDSTVLCIGSGVVIRQVLQQLIEQNCKNLLLVCRNAKDRAELAKSYGLTAYAMDKCDACVQKADVVISATGSRVPVVRAKSFVLMRPCQLLLDLAVPRDIEVTVGCVKDVTVLGIDAITPMVERNRCEKEKAQSTALTMVSEQSQQSFASWADWCKGRYSPVAVFCREIAKVVEAEVHAYEADLLSEKKQSGEKEERFFGRLQVEVGAVIMRYALLGFWDVAADKAVIRYELCKRQCDQKVRLLAMPIESRVQLYIRSARKWVNKSIHPYVCALREAESVNYNSVKQMG